MSEYYGHPNIKAVHERLSHIQHVLELSGEMAATDGD